MLHFLQNFLIESTFLINVVLVIFFQFLNSGWNLLLSIFLTICVFDFDLSKFILSFIAVDRKFQGINNQRH